MANFVFFINNNDYELVGENIDANLSERDYIRLVVLDDDEVVTYSPIDEFDISGLSTKAIFYGVGRLKIAKFNTSMRLNLSCKSFF